MAAQGFSEVDRAIAELRRGRPDTNVDVLPPAYGDQHRDAVNACIEGLSNDLFEKTRTLEKILQAIAQRALQSAARCKHEMEEHIALCGRLNQEILRLQDVVGEIESKAHDL